MKRLTYICDEENVKYNDGALKSLIETSEGDLRRAITTLQSAARLKSGEQILEEDIFEITGKNYLLLELLKINILWLFLKKFLSTDFDMKF